jgi:hypothetical protein
MWLGLRFAMILAGWRSIAFGFDKLNPGLK